jgi:purine-binding chemotaxis protein CheW
MKASTISTQTTRSEPIQLATFYIADMCLALEIGQIQEIIRQVKVTRVPHAPPQVSGVINLRGEVTTVINLRQVLGLPPVDADSESQTLIVRSQGESIGLVVDRVGDICAVDASSVVPSPPNVNNIDGRFFHGVCQRKAEIIIVLDLEQALSMSQATCGQIASCC